MYTLTYDANGGDTTPKSQESEGSFILADAITRDGTTGKYTFLGWMVDFALKQPKDPISVSKNTTATAQWKLNETTVSPKAYGYSPNGIKNALGTTRHHHQPSYPHAMGVGVRNSVNQKVNIPEINAITKDSDGIVRIRGKYLDVIHQDIEGYADFEWKYHTGGNYGPTSAEIESSSSMISDESSWYISEIIDIRVEVTDSTKGVVGTYTFDNLVVQQA